MTVRQRGSLVVVGAFLIALSLSGSASARCDSDFVTVKAKFISRMGPPDFGPSRRLARHTLAHDQRSTPGATPTYLPSRATAVNPTLSSATPVRDVKSAIDANGARPRSCSMRSSAEASSDGSSEYSGAEIALRSNSTGMVSPSAFS